MATVLFDQYTCCIEYSVPLSLSAPHLTMYDIVLCLQWDTSGHESWRSMITLYYYIIEVQVEYS